MSTSITHQEPELATTVREEARVREPHYSIMDENEAFRVEIALPGAAKDSIKVEQKGDELSVVAERSDTVPGDWKVLHKSIESCNYRLVLQLGHTVDPESIQANYANGLLTLRIAKRGQQPDRVISVN